MNRPSELVLLNRFWQSISMTLDGCWTWAKALTKAGYGVMRWDGRTRTAHRISWEFHNGPIPIGLDVLHKCDNRPCVRPEHLFLGTHADNNHDMFAKGRGKTGVLLTLDGESQHAAEWARRHGLLRSTLEYRLHRGWPLRKALTTPVGKRTAHEQS
jgi:hypothetical protein